MKEYNFKDIEKKWQTKWEEAKMYKTPEVNANKPKCYVLDMFPYPSGTGLHIGHPKGYTATDIYSRFKKFNGFSVLHPMGFDAFGLPAENYAIKNKIHPKISVEKNISKFVNQLKNIGFDYDWEREVNTSSPEYYKWTQWIFLKLYEKGLAYESHEPINWCPSCKTGLANEDLEDGVCERCDSEIEQRPMRQWVLKMTDYADRLIDDLKLVDWEKQIIDQQLNWIGRSEGINIEYKVEGLEEKIIVFTTRPDTNFGATFLVTAPDSKFVISNIDKFPNKEEVKKYVEESNKKTELDRRKEGREKTGVSTGLYAINELNGKKMPVYVGDFVLGSFGTGTVVGVPGHDIRDFEFAQKLGIEIIRVVVGSDGDTSPITKKEQVQEDVGTMINSSFLDGKDIHEATKKIMDYIEEKGIGKRVVNYRLKDWVFSRQRYWGEPIPVVHCEKCGVVPVPENQLPVMLPEVESYELTDTGESPLANILDWVNTTCSKCGGNAKRETNTMPQWAGSSWYYLRYIDPKNNEKLIDSEKEKYWMNVDLYVGGAEHATRHLLYARFWHKFLYDIGVVTTLEPFQKLYHVGLVLAEDGRKMSKRWGNVVDPNDLVEKNGADQFRLAEMFMGPFSQAAAWNSNNLEGVCRFLKKVWKLYTETEKTETEIKEQKIILHKTIKKVTEDIENFGMNTAISSMMIFVNEMLKQETICKNVLEKFIILLAPFAPHISEELWESLGHNDSIFYSKWPKFDSELLEGQIITYVVQVNGKLRDNLQVGPEVTEEEIKKIALELPKIQGYTKDKEIKKTIFVENRLINFVV